ncbi:unnamed protein product, partial [Sphacelaria rigidula]
RCIRDTGRPQEAQRYVKRSLRIMESHLGYDMEVADTLHVLGRCVQQAHGAPEEAEEYFRRALHLKIAVQSRKEGDEDPQVSLLRLAC